MFDHFEYLIHSSNIIFSKEEKKINTWVITLLKIERAEGLSQDNHNGQDTMRK